MSERTIREDCKKHVVNLEVMIRIMVQKAPRNLSFTTDLWTSNQNLGYIAVTCTVYFAHTYFTIPDHSASIIIPHHFIIIKMELDYNHNMY